MLGTAASIATGMIMSKYTSGGKQPQLLQTSMKGPMDFYPSLYSKFARRGRTGTKYVSRTSRPASVETGTYGPLSTYNSILKKQLGLLTSKA